MTTPAHQEGKAPVLAYRPSSLLAARSVRAALVAAGIATATLAAGVSMAPVPAHAAPQESAIKTLEAYDAEIRDLAMTGDLVAKASAGTLDTSSELLILQRDLVSKAGYDELTAYIAQGDAQRAFVSWLMGDLGAMRYFMTGGAPAVRDGGASKQQYIDAIDIFRRLRETNGNDLEGADADVHLRMMVSTALGHSGRSRLWTGDPGFVSDPLIRYRTVKVFRDNAEKYRFQKDLFDSLPVETMRWVFENQITDDELPWLANYSLSRFPENNAASENSRLNAYSYIWYGGVNDDGPFNGFTDKNGYSYEGFYNAAQFGGPVTEIKPSGENKQKLEWKGGWSQKYKTVYDDSNFPNANPSDPYHLGCGEISSAPGASTRPTDYHRLWMVFERGGVCGALAKTYANLNGMVGVPSAVCGQPGHAIAMTYELRENKATGKREGTYRIQNDVSGWGDTGSPDAAHMLGNWKQVSASSNHMRAGTYVLYAQDALNDVDAYRKSLETRLIANSLSDDADRLAAYEAARAAQPMNHDAIKGQIDMLKATGADNARWIELAEGVAAELAYHPLPMNDFLKLIQSNVTDKATEIRIDEIRVGALKRDAAATDADTVNRDASVRIANRLLGKSDGKVVSFSFDGPDANKIKLGDHLQGGGVPWKYRLGDGEWVEVLDGSSEVTLTPEQIESIDPDKDIHVQFIGLSSINTIDIQVGADAPSGQFKNDNLNAFVFRDGKALEKHEARVDGGPWVKLSERNTFEEGVKVEMRAMASGLRLASKPLEVVFAPLTDATRDFIPYNELKVDSYSSVQGNADTVNRVIDGYYGANAFWHNSWAGDAGGSWIVIDLGRTRDLRAFDFWGRPDLGNGTPRNNFTVSVAPDQGARSVEASAFTPVKTFNGIKWTSGKPTRFEFDAPVRARYVKLFTPDKFLAISLLDFYGKTAEDVSFELDVEPEGKGSVRLVATLVGAGEFDGRIEYALCDSNQVPADAVEPAPGAGDIVADERSQSGWVGSDNGEASAEAANPLNTWTADPVFTGLETGVTYYAFARAVDVPGAGTVTSGDAVEVELLPDEGGDGGDQGGGDQGGNGDGGDQGGNGDGGQTGDDGGAGSNGPNAGNTGSQTPGGATDAAGPSLPATGDPSLVALAGAGASSALVGAMARFRASRKRRP